MKTLKKVLAVALAVVMALSLVTIASAATTTPTKYQSYSDASSIKNTEAVDTLTAIGVLSGMGDGTFAPAGNFTREQAAKIIAYMLLGSSSADSLKTTVAPFSDVAADRWSAPYIQFCVVKGIINGMGDGTFAPTASVTGAQFAKMLLTAIGYGKLGEYTGSDWSINAIVDAQNLKILTTGVDYNAAATRDQVALYAFNAYTGTKCYVVALSKDLSSYVTTNSAVVDNLAYRQSVTSLSVGDYNGVASHKWTKSGVTLTGNIFANSAVNVLYSGYGVGLQALTTSGNTNFVANFEGSASLTNASTYSDLSSVKFYLNGAPIDNNDLFTANGPNHYTKTAYGVTTNGFIPLKANVDMTAWDMGYLAEGGMQVQLADTNSNGLIDSVYFTEKTATVLGADAVVNTSGYVTVPGVCSGVAKANVIGYDGLKKDDVVLYYKDGAGVYHIEKATEKTGQMTAGSSTYVTIGGAFVFASGLPGTDADFATLIASGDNFNTDMNYWVDNAGNMVYYDFPTTSTTTYCVVLGYQYTPLTTSAVAKVMKDDGTVATYTVAPDASGSVTSQETYFGTATSPIYALASYTLNSNGLISLTPISSTTLSTDYAKDGQTMKFTGLSSTFYLSSSTKVFYYDTSKSYSTTNPVYLTTGFSATAAIASAGTTVYYGTVSGSTSVLSVVFARGNGLNGSSVGSTKNYAFAPSILGAVPSVTYTNGSAVYSYMVYVDGTPTTLKSAYGNLFYGPYNMASQGLFTYTLGANGYVISTAYDDTTIPDDDGMLTFGAGSATAAVDTGYVALANGTVLLTNSNTKYYLVNGSPMSASVTASAIGKSSDTVHYTVIAAQLNSSYSSNGLTDAVYFTYTVG